jgi:uncharacterized protein
MGTHANAELVRKGYAAFNSGDIATLTEVIATDCVQHMPGKSRFSGDHKGRDAILAMYGEIQSETDGTFRAELLDTYADDHRVVAIHRTTATRKGKTLDEREALVFEIVGGRATDMEVIALDGEPNDAFWS